MKQEVTSYIDFLQQADDICGKIENAARNLLYVLEGAESRGMDEATGDAFNCVADYFFCLHDQLRDAVDAAFEFARGDNHE